MKFFLDLLERTARTFVQGFLAVVTVDAVTSLDATWTQTILAGALAGAYAVLTAFAAGGVSGTNSASFHP